MRILTNRITRRLAGGAAVLTLALSAGACRDFLTGERLTENPNSPTQAGGGQVLVASQVSLFVQQEGQLARLAAMYVQQLSGTNNQQQSWGSQYAITESDLNGHWNPNFTGAGLANLRAAQEEARAGNDQRLLGMLLVLEALRIGTVTSIWGDIPYSEAVTAVTTPRLDPQQQVYAAIQAKLDTAITALRTVPANAPGYPQDVIFNGNAARWLRVAHTLKARYHMHTFERLGAPAAQAALAAAQQGINEGPTTPIAAQDGQAPGSLRAVHGTTVNVDANLWAQFQRNRQDMTANQVFIDILTRRNDPRMPRFFQLPGGQTTFRGADQFGRNGAQAATLNEILRVPLDFRQPIVTWEENELLLAEAKFRTGDLPGALQNVNNVRTAVGLPTLTGPITLQQIAEEKYVAMFQNIEAWNDYKRLCFPTLTPGGANNTPAREIPGRLVYPFSERNANPNIPAPSAQPARNWNDPNACQ